MENKQVCNKHQHALRKTPKEYTSWMATPMPLHHKSLPMPYYTQIRYPMITKNSPVKTIVYYPKLQPLFQGIHIQTRSHHHYYCPTGHGYICMDFITSLSERQMYDAILVMIERFAKLPHMVPIVGTTTPLQVAQCSLNGCWRHHMLLKVIVSY